MSGTVNKVILIGRLGADPKVTNTPSGVKRVSFSVATDRRGQPQEGQPTADFTQVVAWNQGNRKLADLAETYLHKGSKVYVEGRLQTRSWDDNNGIKRYITEVQLDSLEFMDTKAESEARGATHESTNAPSSNGTFEGRGTTPATSPSIPPLSSEDEEAASMVSPSDIPF